MFDPYSFFKEFPNKIILPKKNVCKVFETPANYFNIELGDYMEGIK